MKQDKSTSLEIAYRNKNRCLYGKARCYKPQFSSLTEQKRLYKSLWGAFKLPICSISVRHKGRLKWCEIRSYCGNKLFFPDFLLDFLILNVYNIIVE